MVLDQPFFLFAVTIGSGHRDTCSHTGQRWTHGPSPSSTSRSGLRSLHPPVSTPWHSLPPPRYPPTPSSRSTTLRRGLLPDLPPPKSSARLLVSPPPHSFFIAFCRALGVRGCLTPPAFGRAQEMASGRLDGAGRRCGRLQRRRVGRPQQVRSGDPGGVRDWLRRSIWFRRSQVTNESWCFLVPSICNTVFFILMFCWS